MNNLTINEKFAPILSEVGFLECDAEAAAKAYQTWQIPIQMHRGVTIKRLEVPGTLDSKIKSLLPLTNIERRRSLFLPTDSNWCAYLDNGWRGTDAYSVVSYLCSVICCRGIRAVCIPNTYRKTEAGPRGRYGATIFELYAAGNVPDAISNTERSVYAANDGGTWKFGASGVPCKFEEVAQYKSRQIRDRFTPEMLDRYLQFHGIEFFSSTFYDRQESAQIVAKFGPSATGMKSYSLDEVRSQF